MKKTIITAALALTVSLCAGAKTADELRVYINPGHGSWTPNDRPMQLVNKPDAYSRTNTDTTSFFESNTNLRKGLALLQRLKEYGLKFDETFNQTGELWQIGAARDLSNNIVMSHVKCGPYHDDNGTANQLGDQTPADIYYYNRLLSEVRAEVQDNNFDMFISIHSNAASEGSTSNYPLYLYRGYDEPRVDDPMSYNMQLVSIDMCKKSWPYAYANTNMVWTSYASSMNVRGDCNFYRGSVSAENQAKIDNHTYTGYLGVLPNTVPGFLVEGYFHTYQPARHRAMNWDVCAVEGDAYAHGIAEYYGLSKESKGTIYGIVRDQHQKFADKYYSPNPSSDDIFKPLNGATVVLKKGETVVAEYTTDGFYNGAYVFRDIEPGKYTVEASHPDYKGTVTAEVEVTAAGQTFPAALVLESNDYVPPSEEIANYPDPVKNSNQYGVGDEMNFKAEYVDQEIAELAGKTIRRAILRSGKMYILAVDAEKAPTLIVYDPNKKQVLANVSTEGTSCFTYTEAIAAGMEEHLSTMPLSDIQVTADGVLLGVNKTWTSYLADKGVMQVYKWENDENGLPTGTPSVLASHKYSGLWYNSVVGNTFTFTGSMDQGSALISAPTTGSSGNLRAISFNVVNGAPTNCNDLRSGSNNVSVINATSSDYRFITSPLDDNMFYLVDEKYGVGQFEYNKAVDTGTLADASDELKALGTSGLSGIFKYAGKSFMVTATKTDGLVDGIALVNISDNINKPKFISTANTGVDAMDVAGAAAMGETETETDPVSDQVVNAWMSLYLLRDGKLTKFTTKDVAQPVYKTEFAYDLKVTDNSDNYEIAYALTGDAVAARLVLTPKTDGEVIEIPVDATKGSHSVSVAVSDLATDTEYTVSIDVESKSNATIGEISSVANPVTKRGSVITFTDPEFPTYGYTVIGHNSGTGFDVYNPAGERVSTEVHKGHSLLGSDSNQSNPLRGAEHMGHALVAAWGDNAHGVTAFNPLDPTEDLYSVFEGDKASNGLISYNGTGIGSGTPCVAIQGRGESTRMFTFDEDLLSNHVAVYNIGTSRTITEAPADWGRLSLDNTNVELQPVENGVFASQVRANFLDTGCPSIEFISNEGSVLWKAAQKEDWPADMIADCNSGLAVNNAGTLLAVSGKTGIRIFDLSFDADNKPVLNYRGGVKVTSTDWATMRFDAANNLHYYGRGDAYRVYALNRSNPVVTTPAKAEYVLKGASGIEDIVNDTVVENEAPVTYYNLNGVQVQAENLTPGVYVKVQGKKATKVVVK